MPVLPQNNPSQHVGAPGSPWLCLACPQAWGRHTTSTTQHTRKLRHRGGETHPKSKAGSKLKFHEGLTSWNPQGMCLGRG